MKRGSLLRFVVVPAVELGGIREPEPIVDGVYHAAVVQQFEDVVDVAGGKLVVKG